MVIYIHRRFVSCGLHKKLQNFHSQLISSYVLSPLHLSRSEKLQIARALQVTVEDACQEAAIATLSIA